MILILLMWCCNTRKTVVEFNLIGSSGIQPELVVNGEEREIEVDDSGYAKLMLTEGEHGYATFLCLLKTERHYEYIFTGIMLKGISVLKETALLRIVI